MVAEESTPDKCPIDHTARAAWLEAASQGSQASPSATSTSSSTSPPSSSLSSSFSLSSIYSYLFPSGQATSSAATGTSIGPNGRPIKTRALSKDREVSTIPRADPTVATATPNISSRPANNENESGSDSRSGAWIYPSEKMFFEAMKRKNYDPRATDMVAIVPIHNAVNEKAWKEIKEWESRFSWSATANMKCGGPRLHSFSGDSSNLSPKARLNTLLGYQAPFDRHDWVVERCPGEPNVEYVIDFYAGRSDGKGKGLNFYLDVRPKLNSWEGWKMRAARLVGV